MAKFITLEGSEGAGKSTQLQRLTEFLKTQDVPVYFTREPGGTVIGDKVRDILHDVAHTEMDAVTEILLYSASRAQLVAEVVKPKLAQGIHVICDRYADSTLAYQGYGRRLDKKMLQMITRFATQSLVPDMTLYLDVPIDIGLQRREHAYQTEGGEMNRMDQQKVEFYHRVRDGYLQMAQADPQRWVVVDARPSLEAVQQNIRQIVCDALEI